MANCHEAVGYRKLSGHYAGNGEIMTWLTATCVIHDYDILSVCAGNGEIMTWLTATPAGESSVAYAPLAGNGEIMTWLTAAPPTSPRPATGNT